MLSVMSLSTELYREVYDSAIILLVNIKENPLLTESTVNAELNQAQHRPPLFQRSMEIEPGHLDINFSESTLRPPRLLK